MTHGWAFTITASLLLGLSGMDEKSTIFLAGIFGLIGWAIDNLTKGAM